MNGIYQIVKSLAVAGIASLSLTLSPTTAHAEVTREALYAGAALSNDGLLHHSSFSLQGKYVTKLGGSLTVECAEGGRSQLRLVKIPVGKIGPMRLRGGVAAFDSITVANTAGMITRVSGAVSKRQVQLSVEVKQLRTGLVLCSGELTTPVSFQRMERYERYIPMIVGDNDVAFETKNRSVSSYFASGFAKCFEQDGSSFGTNVTCKFGESQLIDSLVTSKTLRLKAIESNSYSNWSCEVSGKYIRSKDRWVVKLTVNYSIPGQPDFENCSGTSEETLQRDL